MNRKKLICACCHVTKGDILDAMEKGNDTFKKIKKDLNVTKKCGHCKKKIKKFIKKHGIESDAG